MRCPAKCWVVFVLVAAAALAIRLPRLTARPMHGDEAVNAVKFGQLLEEGFYRYDPHEYHGPTLNYFTLIAAWLGSAEKLAQVGEFTLRIVPVFFGVLLVLMLLLLVDGLGKWTVIFAAALTAVSPAMVFYSRYYIHETLLVCFTFGVIVSGYRYAQTKCLTWAILTGLFTGLAYTTKETCIIAFASMVLAVLLTLIVFRRPRHNGGGEPAVNIRHIIAAAATAIIISVLFYSSFFTNSSGVLDSVRAYGTYLNRATQDPLHIHPWYYYLKMLIYSRYGAGPVWSEGLIIVLAGTGFVVAMKAKSSQNNNVQLLRFFAFYTLVSTVIYSAIGYKTPWSMLTFLHGMIVLAAIGATGLIQLCPNLLSRRVLGLIFIFGLFHLTWQAYQANYTFSSDQRNPYVYAHTTNDIFQITERVEQIAQVHPDRYSMHIEVICPNNDYWPLPWYLRRFNRVGWYSKVDDSAPIAPLIIASPAVEAALGRKIYEVAPQGERNLYVPLFDTCLELRPTVEITGFVTKDLRDKFQAINDDSTDQRPIP
ncbi:MAG: hypothetical protein DRP65_06770 [Planctomycetota bacterium]|nr:MAG: hypothetical protein DRP65_06770 [Planctomycetota bacterium]